MTSDAEINDRYLRMQCLHLAATEKYSTPEATVKVARTYYDFVVENVFPPKQETPDGTPG